MIFLTVCNPQEFRNLRVIRYIYISIFIYFNLYDILANYLDLNALKNMRYFHCLPTYYSVFISLCWTSPFHVTCIKKWHESCFVVMTLKMYILHTTKCMIYVLFYMVFGKSYSDNQVHRILGKSYPCYACFI